jgi:chlorite dismutase
MNNQTLDLSEKGKSRDGEVISLNRRLFMQLLAFGDCRNLGLLIEALEEKEMHGALYLDVNDPQGVALVTFSEEPDYFVTTVRDFLNAEPFISLTPKPEYTMLGRTYSIGYERNLEDVLIKRSARRVCNPEWPWAVWYPLRRKGSFEQLPRDQQMQLLGEHGKIGRAYGEAGYGHDIRLACHGIDKNDNEFVIGLVGSELFPLSAIVQAMRKTKQTSQHMEKMGPFFVGKAIWQKNRQE